MELVPVICNHCGASLQVSESARFVTCRYCNSQLEIKRTESTVSTEVLQRIDQNTAAMAQDLQAIRRETELERIDREWSQKQAMLMVRDKNGNVSRPGGAGGLIGSAVTALFGILWTIFSIVIMTPNSPPQMGSMPGFPGGGFSMPESMGPPMIIRVIFPLFGVVFVIGAIVMGFKSASAASQFEEEERQYQLRRQQILDARQMGEREMSNT